MSAVIPGARRAPNLDTVSPEGEQEHYSQARSWDDDRVSRIERSERRAWIVAGCAIAVALCAFAGLAMLAPLKRSVPYVLSVDRASGNVEVLDVAEPRSIAYQPLLDKHWAQRYVVARESYHWQMLQHDYDTVLAMSDNAVGRDYAQIFEGKDARDKKLGPSHELRVKILSVTAPPDNTRNMVVRFERQLHRVNSGPIEPPQSFVATLAFEYHVATTAVEKQLLANPLGFRVVGYRLDAETGNTRPNS